MPIRCVTSVLLAVLVLGACEQEASVAPVAVAVEEVDITAEALVDHINTLAGGDLLDLLYAENETQEKLIAFARSQAAASGEPPPPAIQRQLDVNPAGPVVLSEVNGQRAVATFTGQGGQRGTLQLVQIGQRWWISGYTYEHKAQLVHYVNKADDARFQRWQDGFERSRFGSIQDDWFAPLSQLGYQARIVSRDAFEGSRAVSLSGPATRSPEYPFANVMRMIDATPYRGKRVRFSAAVRVESPGQGTKAQLWLRVDRGANRGVGLFDNMRDRPIVSEDWGTYEITGVVDADAALINIGMMQFGPGAAWLDAVSFEIVE